MSDDFYAKLPAEKSFRAVFGPNAGHPIPDDWHVVLSDVSGSTAAIDAGRYKEVNAVGVSTISAVRAAVPIEIPFVFGGDGSTLCVPATYVDAAAQAMGSVASMARDVWGLDLRIGTVPISRVREAGFDVRVAKHSVSAHFRQASFFGGGLEEAERLLKTGACEPTEILDDNPDLRAVECRWEPVRSIHGETVSYLVKANTSDAEKAHRLYVTVLERLEGIYGSEEDCAPVAREQLRMSLSSRDLSVETNLRTHGASWWRRLWYAIVLRYEIIVGRIVFANNGTARGVDWGVYQDEVVANTDSRKFDDMLRLVVSGTVAQREAMVDYLDRSWRSGQLNYGAHASDSALLTCVVDNRHGGHVHFVDGADGGYALAAKEMKKRGRGEVAARVSGARVQID